MFSAIRLASFSMTCLTLTVLKHEPGQISFQESEATKLSGGLTFSTKITQN